MIEIDNILGKRVSNISFLTCQFDSTQVEIEKILINFGTYNLLLEIDSESDQIIPRIVKDFTFKTKRPEHNIVNVTGENLEKYETLLDSKLIWLWEMTNNQGYFDGIQMEFENNRTFQFLVESSYFRNSELKKI